MKNIVFTVCVLLVSVNIANAETYIQYKGDSIIGMSSKDDMVADKGASIKIIAEDMDNLGITRDLSFYKLKGNKIVLDSKSVVDYEEVLVSEEKVRQGKSESKVALREKIKTSLSLTDAELDILLGVN